MKLLTHQAVLFVAVSSVFSVVSARSEDHAATSALPTAWDRTSETSLFGGRPGKWDTLIRERGWVMKDGATWKLWYTGYDKGRQPLTMKLGYATSQDGISWQRYSDEPIYDETWVEDMMVVKHGDRYLMFAEAADNQSQLLESSDGISWSRIGNLDVRQANGEPVKPGPLGTPTAFHHANLWYLFYERRDAGIWVARSADLRVWTNISDDPVLVPGPEDYDRLMIAMNQVVCVDGRFIAVMHGTGTPQKPRAWCTYLAESNDLLSWAKRPEGPLIPGDENKSSGVLVDDGNGWRLYTMHAEVDLWKQAK